MKKPVIMVLWALCVVMVFAAPFVFSSPAMLSEVKEGLMEEMDGGYEEEEEYEEEAWLPNLLFASARAEEAEQTDVEEAVTEAEATEPLTSEYTLPLDFTVPPAPNPACYTDTGYEDESIRVRMEDMEEEGVIYHLAYVQIASPTQLRTATAGTKLTSTKAATVSGMAKHNNAVVAMNGDNYQDHPQKTTFEYRMTEKIRRKANKTKDILIIDREGDFHMFVKSAGAMDYEGDIVNAWTFGPALVIDGQVQTVDKEYGYNPNGKEPRAAFGQTGKLSYVFVIVEGRGKSSGVTHQELANFMGRIGCVQAFNFDGGNSGEMVFGETIYKAMPGGAERGLNDIIYFATAVPEESWQ